MLVPIMVLSRVLAALALLIYPTMEGSGYATLYKKNAKPIHKIILYFFLLLTLAIGIFVGEGRGAFVLLAEIVSFLMASSMAYRGVGGFNGDGSGFAITVSEASSLVMLTLLQGVF